VRGHPRRPCGGFFLENSSDNAYRPASIFAIDPGLRRGGFAGHRCVIADEIEKLSEKPRGRLQAGSTTPKIEKDVT